jgi:transposase
VPADSLVALGGAAMNDLFLLTEAQMRRIKPYFPLSHGVARVDDRRVISGIVFVIRNGLRWRDAPREYGPHKTIYNRFVRWSRLGVFNKIFAELARKAGKPSRLMIDATHLKAHRTAASLLKRGSVPRRIGRTKGGLNSKLYAVCDGQGRPLIMLLSEGQMSDYKGAALMLDALPPARQLLGDKGYDADWFRQALAERGITACIPSKSNRKKPIEHDRELYRQRHKIENMFGRLKDWRRIHTRYDRCAHTFMSAICIAAAIIFWL